MNRRRRRGWLLWEMTIVIILLGVFGVISARLLTSCIRMMARIEASHNRINRVETMLGQLRRDVWDARAVRAVKGGVEIDVVSADQTLVWTGAGDEVRRAVRFTGGAARPRVWQEMGPTTLEAAAGGVRLILRDEAGRATDELLVPSEVLMMREVPQ